MERVVVWSEVTLQHRQRLWRESACPEQPLASRVVGTAHLDGQRRCGGGDVAGRHTGCRCRPSLAPPHGEGAPLGPRGRPCASGRFSGVVGGPHGLLRARALWPCRPTSTLKLAVAILTMAILTMAILTMAILTMAILTMAHGEREAVGGGRERARAERPRASLWRDEAAGAGGGGVTSQGGGAIIELTAPREGEQRAAGTVRSASGLRIIGVVGAWLGLGLGLGLG